MPTVAGKKYAYTAKGKAAAKAAKKKKERSDAKKTGAAMGKLLKGPLKKKKSDQSKQSVKRRAAAKEGSWRRKGVGRPMTAAEERYYSGKRYA